MNEKETSNLNKKIEKMKKDAEKKSEKKAKKNEKAEKNEDRVGLVFSEIFLVFIILLVWVAIFAFVIKMDIGGFGSNVMTPILKNVPYLKMILPS